MNNYSLSSEYAEKISKLRYDGDIVNAINMCKEAIDHYPDSDFFYKIHGDLLFQDQKYYDAFLSYTEQLKRIEEKPQLFRCFARFYQRIENVVTAEQLQQFQEMLQSFVERGEIGLTIQNKLIELIGIGFIQRRIDRDVLTESLNDKNLDRIKSYLDSNTDDLVLQRFITYHTSLSNRTKCKKIESYLITIAEKKELYKSLLPLLGAIIKDSQKPNPIYLRSLLRICRKIGSYDYADKIISIDTVFVEKSDFNIQYELMYYFQAVHNEDLLELTIKMMRSGASRSIPIAKTLYNFLLSLNRLEEAQSLYYHIESLLQKSHSDNRKGEELETTQVVWQKLKDLISEQEHYRQMEALSDLLKGFSHELGQPVTNIRFSVQLQQMKLEKGVDILGEIEDVFDSILAQTERIGTLLNRFRPIVSSKSSSTRFSLSDCIQQVFFDLSDRLAQKKIVYEDFIDSDCYIFGDQVQFSQIFYNLALNSMQAMEENGKISVRAKKKGSSIIVYFSDTGPGVPAENSHKIFQPFYTTKEPTSGNGGEGLGLFIVWNILKMFNGTIRLEKKNKGGACFVIDVPFCKEGGINE